MTDRFGTIRPRLAARMAPMWSAMAALSVVLTTGSAAVQAQPAEPAPMGTPAILRDVAIDQKLGAQVPAELAFKDETGRDVKLGDYFGKRPIVLTLVYYNCPMLCTMVLNDTCRCLNDVPLKPGSDFDIVTVSFDAKEGPQLAAEKKAAYLRQYKQPTAAQGWHFLTGSQASIDALTHAVGFRYAWDAHSQSFAHASGIMVLTPEGKISRYFFGIDYESVDMRLALGEASGGHVGGLTTQILLYCFHYDPVTGRYGLIISRTMKVAGTTTLLVLVGGILMMLRRERHAPPPPPPGGSLGMT